jgi:deoxyadenosine/deoxycytidine kinase
MENFNGLDSVVKEFYNDERCVALRNEFSQRKHVIGIAGNIGVGKSTLAYILSKITNCPVYQELAKPNPYLDEFYKDPKKWAYASQMFFLEEKAEKMKQVADGNASAIVDRTIYEDVGVFGRAQNEFGFMNEKEWADYEARSREITENLPYPDMIIYLRGNPNPTLIERINERKRPEEMNGSTLDEDYLQVLHALYELMINSLRVAGKTKVKIIGTDYSKQEIVSNCEKESVIGRVTEKAVEHLYNCFCRIK